MNTRFFQMTEVADGVFAAIAEAGQGAWGNAGLIDLGGATLVADTFSTPAAGAELRRAAEALLPNPVCYVVNTHWHFDHVFGNQAFSDATIIATEKTRQMMADFLPIQNLEKEAAEWETHVQDLRDEALERASEREKHALRYEVEEKQQILRALPELRLTLPTLAFEDKIRLQGTKRAVDVLTYGGGHSASDAVLHLPEDGVLFAGDLVFANTHPSIHAQPVEEWLAILDKLQELDFHTVVSGHGPVGGREHVRATAGYLAEIHEAAKSGQSLDELLQRQAPHAYETWAFAHVYAWNLKNLYASERK